MAAPSPPPSPWLLQQPVRHDIGGVETETQFWVYKDVLKVWEYESISTVKAVISKSVKTVKKASYVGLAKDTRARFQSAKDETHRQAKVVVYYRLVFHGNSLDDTKTAQLQKLEDYYMADAEANKIASGYSADAQVEYHLYFIVK